MRLVFGIDVTSGSYMLQFLFCILNLLLADIAEAIAGTLICGNMSELLNVMTRIKRELLNNPLFRSGSLLSNTFMN